MVKLKTFLFLFVICDCDQGLKNPVCASFSAKTFSPSLAESIIYFGNPFISPLIRDLNVLTKRSFSFLSISKICANSSTVGVTLKSKQKID